MISLSRSLVLLLATLASVTTAAAQNWPARPLTLVVGFPAGGADDAIARIFAPRLAEKLGQPVNVENVAGKSGLTAATRVAKAEPDGYEIIFGSSSIHAASQSVFKNPPYKSDVDFAPVALLVEQPFIVVARKDFSAANLQDFLLTARRTGAPLRYGSAGIGSATHLSCERFNQAAGIQAQHVAFNGGGPALQALLAGGIDFQCPVVTLPIAKIKSGEVNGIAILSRGRSSALPELRSAQEQGMTGFEATTWFALFLPAASPPAVVQELNAAAAAVLDDAAVQKSLSEVGGSVVAPDRRSPEYLGRFLKSEIEKWASAVTAAGISLD